jgi:hypothetical protein
MSGGQPNTACDLILNRPSIRALAGMEMGWSQSPEKLGELVKD